MKKIFTTLLLAMVAVVTWAYDVEVDGIYYKLNSTEKTAEVTYKTTSYNSYSGSVTIPDTIESNGTTYSVTSIVSCAFYGCTGLKSVTIPNSVTRIGGHAFYNCSGLTSVTIPNSVNSIGEYAFSSCSRLTSVTIPDSVNSIGSSAFSACTGLTSVTIGNSVTSIGSYAFQGCSVLTSVTIGNSVTSIGRLAFSDCTGLTSVTIPNSVTSIGDYAFGSCTGLTSVTIPNSVNSIGGGAFFYCTGLTSVTIGNSVTSIGDDAFNYSNNIKAVTCNAEKVPSMGTNVFSSKLKNATLKVPDASVDLYKAADQWKDFGTIVGIGGKCATPTIALKDGKVVATSETEGATCTITKEVKSVGDGYSLVVTAYATAEGFAQSETATATYPLSIGERGDTNGDGTVNVSDVNSLVDKLLFQR